MREDRAQIVKSHSHKNLHQQPFRRPIFPTFEYQQEGKEGQNREDHDDVFESQDHSHALNISDPSGALPKPAVNTITSPCMSNLYKPISLHCNCNCSCHERHSTRSPRATDRIIGTLFTGYLDVPFFYRRCNKSDCKRPCSNSQISISLTYFFPLWFLSKAISLSIQQHIWGFDYNLRVNHCVSFSSAIFQYSYQGNTSGIKSILKARSGSPFDITYGTQRSLLGVWPPFSLIDLSAEPSSTGCCLPRTRGDMRNSVTCWG